MISLPQNAAVETEHELLTVRGTLELTLGLTNAGSTQLL